MAEIHEGDYRRQVEQVHSSFLEGTSIEIIRDARGEQPPEFALFDFDGTLSLVREGWVDVMVPMMVEELLATGTGESPEALGSLCREFVDELTGKQTIYQMIRLAEEVRQRGAEPAEPLAYKHRYLERLMERISGRREQLASGEVSAETLMVPGSLELLEGLKARDVTLCLASGTDEVFVRQEAELLGIAGCFDGGIHGAVDEYRSFSKQMVIERILAENPVDPSRLIGFGDGYVEIDNVRSSGGLAVGVASDESGRSGRPDAWKRDRLIGVGADVVVSDFAEAERLLAWLWRE